MVLGRGYGLRAFGAAQYAIASSDMVLQAQLCSRCQDVLERPFEKQEMEWDTSEYAHHETLVSLEVSAREGCPICQWILSKFHDHKGSVPLALCHSDDYGTIPMTSLYYRIFPNRGRERDQRPIMQAHFTCPLQEFSCNVLENVSICAVIEDMPAEIDRTDAPASCYTGSEKTLSLAANWLQHCDSYHQCHAPPTRLWCPTRLILLCQNSDNGISARLTLHGEGIPSGARYTALSHRWLNDDPARLTTENQLQFLQNLPLDSLKTSIRHAAEVSVRLGIEYIWVDSLCIVQDDDEDKRKEISAMDQIYSHAYLTICAAFADSLEEGCFSRRDSRMVSAYSVMLTPCRGTNRVPKEHVLRLGHDTESEEGPHYCMLSQRAWCLQERFLSHRKLYFDRIQVYWECQSLEASETFPEGLLDSFEGSQEHDKHLATRSLSALETGEESGRVEFRKIWATLVHEYTFLKLSFPGDRLHALQGIARWCESISHDEYILGLWRSTLLLDLLWSIRRTDLYRPPKRLEGIAPTWSWGSANGICVPLGHRPKRRPVAQAEYVANFRLAAGSRKDSQPKCSRDNRLPILGLTGRPFMGVLELDKATDAITELRLDTLPSKEDRLSSLEQIVPSQNIHLDVDDRGQETFPIKVIVIPLLEEDTSMMYGLLLVRVESVVGAEDFAPVYRRIGMCGIEGGRVGSSWADRLSLDAERVLIVR